MTATTTAGRGADVDTEGRVRLLVQPLVVLAVAVAVIAWAFTQNLTATQKETINPSNLAHLVWQHLLISIVVAAIVVAIAVPLGTALSRPGVVRFSPIAIAIANIGQATPAIGLLVLLFLWTATTGFWIGVIPIAIYSLLPVLANTLLGYASVDRSVIDAGRGQGMSKLAILWRLEFPLAIPYILAGLRTSLVLAVGTATLSFLVDAGGLGILIDTGYKLRDNVALVLGAVLAACLALLVDWAGALAERWLGPKGLRV
ncbi:ABC transporter permease [Williamsia sp. SKLECPSW1]